MTAALHPHMAVMMSSLDGCDALHLLLQAWSPGLWARLEWLSGLCRPILC